PTRRSSDLNNGQAFTDAVVVFNDRNFNAHIKSVAGSCVCENAADRNPMLNHISAVAVENVCAAWVEVCAALAQVSPIVAEVSVVVEQVYVVVAKAWQRVQRFLHPLRKFRQWLKNSC